MLRPGYLKASCTEVQGIDLAAPPPKKKKVLKFLLLRRANEASWLNWVWESWLTGSLVQMALSLTQFSRLDMCVCVCGNGVYFIGVLNVSEGGGKCYLH